MNKRQDEFGEVRVILEKYYGELLKRAAKEIVERREDFESAGFMGVAEEIIEKYATRFNQLSTVHRNLCRFSTSQKPAGSAPLGKDEFRCFSCGGVIRLADQWCPECGWSWK